MPTSFAAPALAGFLTCASLIVAIGAQNAFVLRQGIRREHVLAVVTVCVLADTVLVAAGVAGLGVLVTSHPATLSLARWGGAGFLLVLAAGAVRRSRRPAALDPTAHGPASLRAVLSTCLALTFLNPHVYLDTVVLLGSLAHRHDPSAWSFGAGATAASAAWFSALGFGAARLRPLFARPRAWQVLDLVIAAVMAVLAVLLVV